MVAPTLVVGPPPSRHSKFAVQPRKGPEEVVNGSVAGGEGDRWCAEEWPSFLQVDPGATRR